MTVRELITELMDFDRNEVVKISLDGDEKIADVLGTENWHGTPIIHFIDWRDKEQPNE